MLTTVSVACMSQASLDCSRVRCSCAVHTPNMIVISSTYLHEHTHTHTHTKLVYKALLTFTVVLQIILTTVLIQLIINTGQELINSPN